MCICQLQYSNLFLHLPPGNHTFVFYICDSIYVLQISSFVSFFFLESTCERYHMIFVSLYLTSSSVWQYLGPFMEKAMAPHSSTLAWKIPWVEEPGKLQSMGLLRVGHDWATSLSLFTFMHWRRKWQPTSLFLPGESWGQRSLVGCHLWGLTESDTTEAT